MVGKTNSPSSQVPATAYHMWLDVFHDWAVGGGSVLANDVCSKIRTYRAEWDKVMGPPSKGATAASLLMEAARKFSIAFPALTDHASRGHHERITTDHLDDEIPACLTTMLSPSTNNAYSWGAQEILNRQAKQHGYARIHWATSAQLARTFGATVRLAQQPALIGSEFDAVYPFSWLDQVTQSFILSSVPFTRKTRFSSSSEGHTTSFEGVFILRQGTGMLRTRSQSHGQGKLQWVRLKPWSKAEMFLCYRDKAGRPDRQRSAVYVSASLVHARGLKLYPPAPLVATQKVEWAKSKGEVTKRMAKLASIDGRCGLPSPPVATKPYYFNLPGPRLAKSGGWGWTPRWELFSRISKCIHKLSCVNAPQPSWFEHQIPPAVLFDFYFRAEVPSAVTTGPRCSEPLDPRQVSPIELAFRFPMKVFNADQLLVPSQGEPLRGLALSPSGRRLPQPANNILIATALVRQYTSPYWVTSKQAKRMGLTVDTAHAVKAPTLNGRGVPLGSLRRSVQEWLIAEFREYALLKGDVDLIAVATASLNTLPATEQTYHSRLVLATKGDRVPTPEADAMSTVTGFFMYGCAGWERVHSHGPLASYIAGYSGGHSFLWVNIDETVVVAPPSLQRACIPSSYFDLPPEDERALIQKASDDERRDLVFEQGASEHLRVHVCARYLLGAESVDFMDLASISMKTYFNGSVVLMGTDEGQRRFSISAVALTANSPLCIGTDGRPLPLRLAHKLLSHAAEREFMSPVWVTRSTAGKLGVYILPAEKSKGCKPLNEHSVEGLMPLAKPSTMVYSMLFAENPIGLALKHCANMMETMVPSQRNTPEMAALAARSNIRHVEGDLKPLPKSIPKGYIKLVEPRWRSIASYLNHDQKVFLSQLTSCEQKEYLNHYSRFYCDSKQGNAEKFRKRSRVAPDTYHRFTESVAKRFPKVHARAQLGRKGWFKEAGTVDAYSLAPHYQLIINGRLQGCTKYITKQLQAAAESAEIRERIRELIAIDPSKRELVEKCAHFWIAEDEVVLGGIAMLPTATPVTLHAHVNGKGVRGCRGVDAARSMNRISTKEAVALAFPSKGTKPQNKWSLRRNLRRFYRRYYANKQYRTWYNADQTTDPARVLALSPYFTRPAQ